MGTLVGEIPHAARTATVLPPDCGGGGALPPSLTVSTRSDIRGRHPKPQYFSDPIESGKGDRAERALDRLIDIDLGVCESDE